MRATVAWRACDHRLIRGLVAQVPVSNMYQASRYIDDGDVDTVLADLLTTDGGGLVRRQIDEAEAFRRNLPDMSYGTYGTPCCTVAQTLR